MYACRLTHLAWNPDLTSELACVTEDGAITVVNAQSGAPGARNDLSSLVVKRPLEGDLIVRSCEWAAHPQLLYYLQGMHHVPSKTAAKG